MEQEIWKTVIYQGETYEKIEVSNYGRMRNTKNNHIYKLHKNDRGYLIVNISLGSRENTKTFRVHRVVAETFIPNPENKPQVNHITGDKTRNEVWNLEWCTEKENTAHAIKTGLVDFSKTSGTNNYLSKLTKDDIIWIKEHYIPKDSEYGCRAIAKKFNVAHSTISRLLNYHSYKDV